MLTPSIGRLLALLLVVSQLKYIAALLWRSSSNQQVNARYELKFQVDLDNSTILKRETQTQIFKCQVRLAPFASQLNATRPRFKSLERLNKTLTGANESIAIPALNSPDRVVLSIDWFRGDQQLVSNKISEAVSVINVELKGNGSSTKNAVIDKKNKARLEIKNTLNGNQLKLTSRLKLNQLKITDSGQYRCIAHANFYIASGEPENTSDSYKLWLVEQTLESNAPSLLVGNNSASASDQQQQPKAQDDTGEGTPKRLAADDSFPTIASGSSKQREPSSRVREPANDRRHATRLEGRTKTGQTPTTNLFGLFHSSPTTNSNSMLLPLPDGTTTKSLSDNDEYGRDQANIKGGSLNQFEDDEDLFKTDPRNEFISNTQQRANDDDDEEQPDRRPPPLLFGDPLLVASEAPTSGADVDWRAASVPEDNKQANVSSSSTSGGSSYPHEHRVKQLAGKKKGASEKEYYADSSGSGVFAVDGYLAGSLDSTRLKLAKFVHKIAPELSCYTGAGEHYRGNVSTSQDGRVCLNWDQVFSAQFNPVRDGNHNNCRNPNWRNSNLDKRGPWCFVQYDKQFDANVEEPFLVANQRGFVLVQGHKPSALDSTSGLRYVQRLCPVSACSEYLWFYIVAPPLGFLVVLTCLVTLLVRSMRKSHYNSIFSIDAQRRNGLPRFNKLLKSRGRFVSKKFGSAKKTCNGHYLDEDIFEIVDDLDWSDGNQTQTQSLSPKSTESLKLTSSFSSSSHDADSRMSACKSTNPIFCDKSLIDTAPINDLMNTKQVAAQQVGPMFATLRCHIRGKQAHQMGLNSSANNKSSTFIEQCDLATSNRRQCANNLDSSQQLDATAACHPSEEAPSLIASSSQSGLSSMDSHCKPLVTSQTAQSISGGHLISYSSSSSTKDFEEERLSSHGNCGEKFIIASELPLLDASSVAIALEQQQPLYEGKFSQVRLAYINEPNRQGSKSSSGRIGAQVAACSLKSNVQSNFDSKIFSATRLRLRNLNHLNILKLIGYAHLEDETGLDNTFSLIYDMAQLVDMSDWLKQQNKDSMTSCEPGNDSGIRRNLTCFTKQIALALDYLHDKEIIHKDLACRNCFIDPTKMLVKLASFNLEPIINHNDNNAQNLKSMIRSKYLLDYYVIDSRPSDSQLLPLSWTPLESILFNKFNKQTDVWSFGCLIYELFSLGEVAYFGYSSKQVIDSVRSNLMPPQPILCPNGIYKLMCKCLSDIPTNRPNVKQIYEQLNLYSGQCSSFLDHHLCSLATHVFDDHQQMTNQSNALKSRDLMSAQQKSKSSMTGFECNSNSITKTKSYANIRNHHNDPLANAGTRINANRIMMKEN